MKKILYLSAVLLTSSLLFFSSCSKDSTTPTPQPPSLNMVAGAGFISGNVTLEPNAPFTVKLAAFQNADSKKKLTSLKVSRTFTPATKNVNADTTLDLNNVESIEITLNFYAHPNVGSEVFEFTLMDKNSETASVSFTVTTAVSYNKYSNIELGSFNTFDPTPSFFASSIDSAMTKSVAANNLSVIDFCFLKSETDHNNYMCAINDTKAISAYALTSWNPKNATKLATSTVSATEFDAISDGSYLSSIDIPDPQNDHSRVALENGKVYSFITVQGKKGLIKVVDLYSRGDFAKFDIIIQK